MYKLKKLLIELGQADSAPSPTPPTQPQQPQQPANDSQNQANMIDWTTNFETFEHTITQATETAKSQFEKALMGKILGKTIIVRSRKGYKQPVVKDYEIDRVTRVSLNDSHGEWVVVVNNSANKEYYLEKGFKITIKGAGTSPDQASAETPKQPEPAVPPVVSPQENPPTAQTAEAPPQDQRR